MTFSKPILATAPNTVKMNWWQYWVGHCWMTGWQSIRSNFRMWSDLMGSNYESYALPRTVEDAEQECIEWFWASLVEDDVYPKDFLEYLMQMVDDIETGKEEVILMNDVMKNLKNKWGEEDDEVK
jgi:hypothetical protein